MTTSLSCPTCGFALADMPSASAHPSSEGRVRYLRCVCGRWAVVLAGRVIGAAGSSDFQATHRDLAESGPPRRPTGGVFP